MPNEFDPYYSGMGAPAPDASTMYPQGRPMPPMGQMAPGQPSTTPPLMQPVSMPMEAPEAVPEEEDVFELQRPEASEATDDSTFELERPAKSPGFLKKLDMINTGVHRGVTHFTYKMLSMIPSEKGRANIKAADKRLQEEHDKNIATGSYLPQAGEIAGEVLITSPLMGPYGGVVKGASMAGKALPAGLKTLGKYGTAGAGGGALFGAMESQRYDAENPEQLINKEAAGNALSNPLTYAAPMIGTKLGAWAEKSRKLQQGSETVKQLLPRDVATPGAGRKLSQTMFDVIPAITGMGKRTRQIESIGGDVHKIIGKMAGGTDAVLAKDLTKFAGTKLQMGLKRIKAGQKELWNKPFRTKPVADMQSIRDVAHESIDLLKNSGIPLTASAAKRLQKGIQKGKMTVDDVKNLQSVLGDTMSTINKGEYGGIGRSLNSEINQLRKRMFEPVQKALSGSDLKDFVAAREYSSRMFQMERNIPQLKKALTDEVAARQVIKSILAPSEKFKKADVMGIMSPRGQSSVKAAKVAQALEASDVGGRLSISSFLKKTGENTDMPELLGESYTAIKGLNGYLTTINQAAAAGAKGRAVIAGAAAVGAIGVGTSEDPSSAALALASYPAALFAANHPGMKRVLGAMTKKMPGPTYKYFTQKADALFARAGYFMSENSDGEMVLKGKDDE